MIDRMFLSETLNNQRMSILLALKSDRSLIGWDIAVVDDNDPVLCGNIDFWIMCDVFIWLLFPIKVSVSVCPVQTFT